MHRDLALVWRAIDTDDAVAPVVVRARDRTFPPAAISRMINRMIEDEAT